MTGKPMVEYQYKCENCGKSFKKQYNRGVEVPLVPCPYFLSKYVHRKFTPPHIIFRGSGFYVNDNRKTVLNKSEKSVAGNQGR